MSEKTIGFVGAGRVARILLTGWQRAGVEFPAVVASDTDPTVLDRLPHLSGHVKAANDNSAAAQQDIVFIAVHPPVLGEILSQIASAVRPDALVVSLAPKMKIAKIAEILGGFGRLARMIPNAPSIVGQGFNPMSFAATLPASDRSLLQSLMVPLGPAPEVAEDTLEAYAIISGMGPTYLWPQLVELVNLAKSFGLTPSEAMTAVTRMAAGAAATLAESGLPAGEVMDLVPVRPLGDCETMLCDAYRSKLPALMEKLRS